MCPVFTHSRISAAFGGIFLSFRPHRGWRGPATANLRRCRSPARGAAALATLMGGGMFLAALVGGLLGWLLVLKKKMLKCDSCGATVTAS